MTRAGEPGPALASRRRPPLPEDRPDLDGDGTVAALGALLRHEVRTRAASDASVGLADALVALFAEALRFDAADPGWPDRDRLLFAPDQQALLEAALALSGNSPGEAAAPFRACQAGGLAVAVGAALAESLLAGRFGRSLVDHRTWVLAGAADLAQGVSHEAGSLAGVLRLDRLTVLWDAGISGTDAAGRPGPIEDTLRRFAAYGWSTRAVDAHDPVALAGGVGMALRSRKPTLLACRAASDPPAEAPAEGSDAAARRGWAALGARGAGARRGWLKRLAAQPRRAEFARAVAGDLPPQMAEVIERVREALAAGRDALPTSEASQRVLQALLPVMPELVGLTADLGRAAPMGEGSGASRNTGGRWLHVGARDQGLAAALDGLAGHGGLLPVGIISGPAAGALAPSPWRATRLGLRTVHVVVRDRVPSAGADDGAAEQLAGLRAVPNLLLLNPADAVETAECWEVALRHLDGPSLLLLSGEARPPMRVPSGGNRSAQGGYVLAEAQGPRHASLIATGASVALAMAARSRLAAERIFVAVVSLPCWALFARTAAEYRAEVLGDARRFGIESGSGFGWERWLGDGGVFLGGEAASGELTPDALAGLVRSHLAA